MEYGAIECLFFLFIPVLVIG